MVLTQPHWIVKVIGLLTLAVCIGEARFKQTWGSAIKEKAKTFGQTPTQQREVESMLNEVNQILEEKRTFTPVLTTPMPHSKLQRKQTSEKSIIEKVVAREKARQRLQYYEQNMNTLSRHPGKFMDVLDAEDLDADSQEKYFEGDIVLMPDQAEEILNDVKHKDDRRRKRKFIRSPNRRWNPDEPIEYSFDGSHSEEQRKIIQIALQHWSNITCLNFKENNSPPAGNRIVFTDVDGCASNVGRHPLGEPQFVSIGLECMRLGVIAHEVAHALGFWHEQSRPDRDKHVTVEWDSIAYGQAGQFTKEMNLDVDTAGVPYDYGSIMHYRGRAFARNDYTFTIMTSIPDFQNTIGQRDQLSFYDIKLMNTIYCSNTCPTKLPCQRGGYTDPRHCDRCRCPDGFTGRLCERVMAGYNAKCGGILYVSHDRVDEITSPNYPEEFVEGQECSWLVVAPEGSHVEMQFVDDFDLYCKEQHSLCMDYVEVRNMTDFANTGMRFCCEQAPPGSKLSETNEMLILFRSFYKRSKGFRARLRAINPSGTWENWSSWSECSATCGGCGERVRTRKCVSGLVCSGSDIERERCNTQVCSECSSPQRLVVPCGLWGLFRCEKVTAVLASCDAENQCCSGYRPRGSECVLESSYLLRRRR